VRCLNDGGKTLLKQIPAIIVKDDDVNGGLKGFLHRDEILTICRFFISTIF
jgi:hypothetical protein